MDIEKVGSDTDLNRGRRQIGPGGRIDFDLPCRVIHKKRTHGEITWRENLFEERPVYKDNLAPRKNWLDRWPILGNIAGPPAHGPRMRVYLRLGRIRLPAAPDIRAVHYDRSRRGGDESKAGRCGGIRGVHRNRFAVLTRLDHD